MIIIALVGFEKAIISVPKVSGVGVDQLVIDKTGGGTIEASISGISPDQTTVYASNVPIYVSAKGVGELTASLNVFDLYKNGVYEKIMGITRDADGVAMVGQDTEAPYVSVVFVSSTADGKKMLLGLTKGRFSHPELALNTSESGGTEPNTETIEGSFVTDSRGIAYMSGVEDGSKLTLEKFINKVNNVSQV
ncbi:major tail protein [Enterococcus phage vB_Efm_LG62]|uniref:Major tail protein n=1 Tax=Enterococcus phage vB_Efm_LG62 TaxID=2970334 RepID=A0A976XIL7_9CAUD|nr:major tail protein [Enterococcus phage vB_Efm_LG62]